MAYKVQKGKVGRYLLDQIDSSGDTWVEIREARQAQHESRGQLLITERRFWTDGWGISRESEPGINMVKLASAEIRLVMVGCNIETENGEPLFKFAQDPDGNPYLDMDEIQFVQALRQLPVEVVSEIHSKILEHNPHWQRLA